MPWKKVIGIALGYANRMKCDSDMRDDVVMWAVEGALRGSRTKEGNVGYILTAAFNNITDNVRKLSRIRRMEMSVPIVAEIHNAADEDFEQRLIGLLSAQQDMDIHAKTEREQAAVALEAMDYKLEEAAAALGVTVPAYKAVLYRMRERANYRNGTPKRDYTCPECGFEATTLVQFCAHRRKHRRQESKKKEASRHV